MTNPELPPRLAQGRANMITVIREGSKMSAAEFAGAYSFPFLLLAETGADVSTETGFRTLEGGPQAGGAESRTAEDLLWAVRPDGDADETGRITAGRSTGNDIVLAFTQISKQHCAFVETADGWKLVDLGSSNGTSLNDSPLQPERPYALQDGDVIDAGSELTLTFMLPATLHQVLPALSQLLQE